MFDSLTKGSAGTYQGDGRLRVLPGGGQTDTHRHVDAAQEEQQLGGAAVLDQGQERLQPGLGVALTSEDQM